LSGSYYLKENADLVLDWVGRRDSGSIQTSGRPRTERSVAEGGGQTGLTEDASISGLGGQKKENKWCGLLRTVDFQREGPALGFAETRTVPTSNKYHFQLDSDNQDGVIKKLSFPFV